MFHAFKRTLVALTLACVIFASALPSYANECDELEAEIQAIEAECLDAAEDVARERDDALRNLAAESAVRAALQVDLAAMRRDLDAEKERRIHLEATRPRPAVWFVAGGTTTVVVAVVVFLVAR